MRRGFLLLGLVMALVAVACGGDAGRDQAATTPSQAAAPTTAATEAATTTVAATTTSEAVAAGFPVTVAGTEINDRPEAIVSLSPTATEILFAIDAGDQVMAVDSFSYYPPEAPVTDLSGFEPNVEAVAEFEPDLVVISFDPGDFTSSLNALGIPVINHPPAASLDDAYQQMRELGAATGHAAEAEELVTGMQNQIETLVAEFQPPEPPLRYYHEVDNTFFSATSSTFAGSIYSLFGLENIADPADTEGFGFPQLSEEFIIEANPDLIFYGCAEFCGTTADTVASRPGWDSISAVQRGTIFELDDDVVSRWGPRLVEFVELINRALAEVLQPVG